MGPKAGGYEPSYGLFGLAVDPHPARKISSANKKTMGVILNWALIATNLQFVDCRIPSQWKSRCVFTQFFQIQTAR